MVVIMIICSMYTYIHFFVLDFVLLVLTVTVTSNVTTTERASRGRAGEVG